MNIMNEDLYEKANENESLFPILFHDFINYKERYEINTKDNIYDPDIVVKQKRRILFLIELEHSNYKIITNDNIPSFGDISIPYDKAMKCYKIYIEDKIDIYYIRFNNGSFNLNTKCYCNHIKNIVKLKDKLKNTRDIHKNLKENGTNRYFIDPININFKGFIGSTLEAGFFIAKETKIPFIKKKLNILNLFAGIGGNRTLWGDEYDITAIEYDSKIAEIYKMRFPNDKVIIGDAYDYFLEHFQNFDFIWASPPCLTHTRLIRCNVGHRYKGKNIKLSFPDLRLYSLILFLKENFRGRWLVENVKGYYKPLIYPSAKIGRHYFWSNIVLTSYKEKGKDQLQFHDEITTKMLLTKGIDEETYELLKELKNTKQVINNCVRPSFGKFVIDSLKKKDKKINDFF